MRLIVEIVSGAKQGHSLALTPGDVRKIGRADDADLTIADDSLVSRLHFSIGWTGTECRVCDLGSRNGTLVNGTSVKEMIVLDGDRITAGTTELRVRIVDDEVRASRPLFRTDRIEFAKSAMGTSETGSMANRPLGAAEPAIKIDPDDPALVPRSPWRPYRDGVGDADAGVRREALYAAAWARQTWLIDYCLSKAKSPRPDDWEPLYLLAVLGRPEHLSNILALAKTKKLGPRRFALIGTFGDSRGVPALLEAMAGDDPLAATAAAAAFEKITAIPIPHQAGGEPRASEAPEGEDATATIAARPDAMAVRSIWKERERTFAAGVRWCRGFDVTDDVSHEVLARLDMESRFEACLRARFEGRRSEGIVALQSFPQCRKTPAST